MIALAALAARLAARVLLAYHRVVSPLLPSACRFSPTCSEYAAAALLLFGLRRGSWLALRRVLRCNPLFAGGEDAVPPAVHRVEAARG